MTWTSTDASVGRNAQVRLSGKLSADAGIAAGPNAFTSPTFYNASADNPELWGAYSAVTTDPLNSADAWLVNETVTASSAIWGSRVVISDSKRTIPGPGRIQSAELGEAVALTASLIRHASLIFPLQCRIKVR